MMTSRLRIRGTVFESASDADIELLARHTHPLTASAGEVIFEQDAPGDTMLYMVRGRVEILRDDIVLNVCGPGEMLGEMSLYADNPRSATVRALDDSEFLLLGTDDLAGLQEANSEICWRLERSIIGVLAQRMRAAQRRLDGELERRHVNQTDHSKSLLGRLSGMVATSADRPEGESLQPVQALRASGFFDDASDQQLHTLSEMFEPMSYRRGDYLCAQGEPGDAVYFVTSGLVDVLVSLPGGWRGRELHRVARLGSGAAIGLIAMVDGWGRTAAVRAAEATDVLALDRPTWLRLFETNERIGSIIRMAVIRAFCRQLTSLDAKFAAAKHENQTTDEQPDEGGDRDEHRAWSDKVTGMIAQRPVLSEPAIRLFNLVGNRPAARSNAEPGVRPGARLDASVGFEVREPGAESRTVYIDRPVITIGATQPAELVLADPSIGAVHAVIDTAPEQCVLIDLGFPRGTLLHGQKIERVAVQAGDRITVGDTSIAFLGRTR